MSEQTTDVKPLTYDLLKSAVESAAALRCRRRLQPAGGPGDKVFPPTYAGAVYAVEQRRVRDEAGNWQTVTCVLLDSVQSQANRMEEALQNAIDEGLIAIPYVSVDFSEADLIDKINRVSSLEAPHRLADAILRDSEYRGKPFRNSEEGKSLDDASDRFATPLFRLSPNCLVFGMWDSTGPKGGLGVKFERALVSEIVAIGANFGTKPSSRIDPLKIVKGAGTLYVRQGTNGQQWTLDEADAELDEKKKPVLFGGNKETAKRGTPAAANHGNVVPDISKTDRNGQPLAGGISCEYIEQTTTLSLIQLRRLRFPSDPQGKATVEQNQAARAMLAAIGLAGAALAFERGADLRSRCVIFPDEPMTWELLDVPGQPARRFGLDRKAALALLKSAADAVVGTKLPWKPEPIALTPSKDLVKLVRESQKLTARSGETNGED